MQIDHLVYAVPDLELAMDELESRLGIRPVFGGQHLSKGTKNALLNLGNGAYLELLAIDKTNLEAPLPRWMGIDLVHSSTMVRWALKTDQIEVVSSILSAHRSDLGKVETGERQKANGDFLRWQMSLPAASPMVDIIPFYVDWSKSSSHPCQDLTEACSIRDIQLSHPTPNELNQLFNELELDLQIRSGQPEIRVAIESPKGVQWL